MNLQNDLPLARNVHSLVRNALLAQKLALAKLLPSLQKSLRTSQTKNHRKSHLLVVLIEAALLVEPIEVALLKVKRHQAQLRLNPVKASLQALT